MLSSASGFASVTLGDAAGTGDINVGTAVLGTHTTLQTQSGNLTLHDAINSAGTGFYDLNLHSGGTTTVLGARLWVTKSKVGMSMASPRRSACMCCTIRGQSKASGWS